MNTFAVVGTKLFEVKSFSRHGQTGLVNFTDAAGRRHSFSRSFASQTFETRAAAEAFLRQRLEDYVRDAEENLRQRHAALAAFEASADA